MTANRTRVQVRGSIGKSVRIPSGTSGSGATIGVDFALPDGSIPTLQQLAAALATGSAIQDQPGNIVPPGGGPTVIWQNVQYVPANVLNPARPVPTEEEVGEEYHRMAVPGPVGPRGPQGFDARFLDDPEDPAPGPPGAAGVAGSAGSPGSPGVNIAMWPDDPEDVMTIPGAQGPPGNNGTQGAPGLISAVHLWPDDPEDAIVVPGAVGPAGAAGSPGAAGVISAVHLWPDDAEDAGLIPGAPGQTGAPGAPGAPGVISAVHLWPDDAEDPGLIPGAAGPVGPTGPQGPAGSGSGAFVMSPLHEEDEVIYPGQSSQARVYMPLFQRGASFSGGTVAIIAANTQNVPIYIPEDCTIQSVEVLTQGGTGSCVLDIWKIGYGSYPPSVANSIVAAAPPTISSGIKYKDTTLTGWTKSLNADDTLLVHLTSCSTFTGVVLVITMKPTGSTTYDGYTNAQAAAAARADILSPGNLNVGSGLFADTSARVYAGVPSREPEESEDALPGIRALPNNPFFDSISVYSPVGTNSIVANARSTSVQLSGNFSIGSSSGAYPQAGYNFVATNTVNVYNYLNTDFAGCIFFDTGTIKFQTAPSGTAGNPVTFTTKLGITQAGLVQIPSSPMSATVTQVETGVAAYKTSTTTSASNVLTADAALSVTFNETGKYKVEMYLQVFETTTSTGGFQFDFNSGTCTVANMGIGTTGSSLGMTPVGSLVARATACSTATVPVSSATPGNVVGVGFVDISGVGTLTLRWAQATTAAGVPTSLALGSYIKFTKIA